jgi:hypothetical protein
LLLRITIAFILCSTAVFAQEPKGLVANFDFDNGELYDRISGIHVKAYGASGTSDRFGNRGYALYLQGNPDCYLNLGASPVLKQTKATISLWVMILQPLHKGTGNRHNPILMTLADTVEECNEAYYIGYHLDLKNINVNTSRHCENQITLYPTDSTSLREWHHVAITYDNSNLIFYLDGILENKAVKNFELSFLAGDSVIVGAVRGSKNRRFLNGCVDDIRFYDRVLSPAEIRQLYNAPNPNKFAALYDWLWIACVAIVILVLGFFIIRLRVSYLVRKEKEKNQLLNSWYEQENRVLSAQMDPHFIFNSLNTIQELIITNENEKAQLYLSKFSRLIRKFLDTNGESYLKLSEEIDLYGRYLEIESLRFGNVFEYHISLVGSDLNPEEVHIPHFLVQPLIENAIWHGLLPKEGAKKLSVVFERVDDITLLCTVDDNGVGRKAKPPSVKKAKRSLALNFIEQRLQLLSKVRGGSYSLVITDRMDSSGKSAGTRVQIRLPIINVTENVTSDYN